MRAYQVQFKSLWPVKPYGFNIITSKMAGYLLGCKLLPEPVMTYHQLNPYQQNLV